jgi:hypothetical protein
LPTWHEQEGCHVRSLRSAAKQALWTGDRAEDRSVGCREFSTTLVIAGSRAAARRAGHENDREIVEDPAGLTVSSPSAVFD